MAIESKIVCICDVCGYMVEANGDSGLGRAEAPENWGHGKFGNIDICPKCVKRVEHVNDVVYRGSGKRPGAPRKKNFSYDRPLNSLEDYDNVH